jgi:holo-[acyl-carrier protein] synthase
MKILGLGVYLADIGRIAAVLAKYPRFAERCFTEHEGEYAFRFAMPERQLAARFTGKEAVMKSMGTGWRRIRWTDIEITGGGNPTVRTSGNTALCAESLGATEGHTSIYTHQHGCSGLGDRPTICAMNLPSRRNWLRSMSSGGVLIRNCLSCGHPTVVFWRKRTYGDTRRKYVRQRHKPCRMSLSICPVW